MWITTEEAIVIYARFCRARYGPNAKSMVCKRVQILESRGDQDGRRIWTEVAREIERQAAAPSQRGAG
jgi:hypothetical protein